MKPSIVILLILILTGCSRYFTPVNSNTPSNTTIQKFIDEDRILILRDGKYVYEMSNVHLAGDDISCHLQKLPRLDISHNSKGKIYYNYKRQEPDSVILKQVHLFTAQKLTDGSVTEKIIPITSISKVEELQFDKKKTTRAHVGTAIGIVVGVGLLIATIGASIAFAGIGFAP